MWNSTIHFNPDYNDNRYNSDLGIYKKGCGLENLLLTYGHDEYLYRVLKQNEHHTNHKHNDHL